MKLNFKYVALNEHEFELYNRFLNENENNKIIEGNQFEYDGYIYFDEGKKCGDVSEAYKHIGNYLIVNDGSKFCISKEKYEKCKSKRLDTIEEAFNEESVKNCTICKNKGYLNDKIDEYYNDNDKLLRHLFDEHDILINNQIKESYCVRYSKGRQKRKLTKMFFCCEGDLKGHMENERQPCIRCNKMKTLLESGKINKNDSLMEAFIKQETEYELEANKRKLNKNHLYQYEKLCKFDTLINTHLKNDYLSTLINRMLTLLNNKKQYENYNTKSELEKYIKTLNNILETSKKTGKIEESLKEKILKYELKESKNQQIYNEISRLYEIFENRKLTDEYFKQKYSMYLNNVDLDKILSFKSTIINNFKKIINQILDNNEEDNTKKFQSSLQELTLVYSILKFISKNLSKEHNFKEIFNIKTNSRFIFDKKRGTAYEPDILLESKDDKTKIVIEFDGDYWHTVDGVDIKKDVKRNYYFASNGYYIIRVKNLNHFIGKLSTTVFKNILNNDDGDYEYNQFKKFINKIYEDNITNISKLSKKIYNIINLIYNDKKEKQLMFKIYTNENKIKISEEKVDIPN